MYRKYIYIYILYILIVLIFFFWFLKKVEIKIIYIKPNKFFRENKKNNHKSVTMNITLLVLNYYSNFIDYQQLVTIYLLDLFADLDFEMDSNWLKMT